MENGQYGWLELSRARARCKVQRISKVSSSPIFCPKEILHPKIADPVWLAFHAGEFDVAAFQAMKAVEVSVRAAYGLRDNLIGVKLMPEAFAPDAGPLTDVNAEGGERVGRMELFAGAIASYIPVRVRVLGLLGEVNEYRLISRGPRILSKDALAHLQC